jgi:aconitate hydratase
MDIDLYRDPLGESPDGKPVYLRDVWPTAVEVAAVLEDGLESAMFTRDYADVFAGDENWRSLDVTPGLQFAWDDTSTYIRRPPFVKDMPREPRPVTDITGARALAVLGDSVTTDHISPAGSIRPSSPAGKWLVANGVPPTEFNSYGTRRGNHEVMIRGTLANPRIRNALAGGVEGGVSVHLPAGEPGSIYDVAETYRTEGVPLIVLAGKEYGTGSSRDWAAKGVALLGVRAVLVESYERIHRSNLIGMGVAPLEFLPGDDAATLGLTGTEVFDVSGLAGVPPGGLIHRHVKVRADDMEFEAVVRIDTPTEEEYYRHGGILPYVVRRLLGT